MWPKLDLFQVLTILLMLLSFLATLYIVVPSTSILHQSLILSKRLGWEVHIFSKQKGGGLLGRKGKIEREIGEWSKSTLGKRANLQEEDCS